MNARRPLHGVLLLLLSACGPEVPRVSGTPFDTDPPRPGPFAGHLVVTNSGDDTLSIVRREGTRLEVAWTVPVGFIPVELEGPHHAVADASGAALFVNLSQAVPGSGSGPHGLHGAGTEPGNVLKLDTRDGTLLDSATVEPNPGDIILSKDGSTLLVSHYDLIRLARAGTDMRAADSALTFLRASDLEVTRVVRACPLAHGVRQSSDGAEVYVSCGTDALAVVDYGSGEVRRVLIPGAVEAPTCEHCPYGLAIAPDDTVWVSALGPNGDGAGGVHVYDPGLASFDSARRIRLCGRAMFSAFSGTPGSETARAYVPEQGPCGDFLRIHGLGARGTPTELLDTIPLDPAVCLNAHMVDVGDEDGTALLVCEGDHVGPGTVVLIDLQTRAVLDHVEVGVFPDGLTRVGGTR